MTRKLILLVATFILLLLAFSIYQFLTPDAGLFQARTGIERQSLDLSVESEGGMEIRDVSDIRLEDRADDGRLRGVYEVRGYERDPDGTYVLDRPRAVLLQRDGKRVYIEGRTGRLWAEQVDDRINVRKGRIEGEVHVWVEMSRVDDTRHPSKRPEASVVETIMRINTADIAFDRDALEMKTDKRFTLASPQIYTTGRGLLIQWNEEPREIRRLRIQASEGGSTAVIRGRSSEMEFLSARRDEKAAKRDKKKPSGSKTPGNRGAATSRPAGQVAAAASATPTTQPDGATAVVVAASQPASRPVDVESAWALDEPGEKTSESSDSASAGQPAAEEATPPEGQGRFAVSGTRRSHRQGTTRSITRRDTGENTRNIYRATFRDNVRVISGDSRLEGLRELTLDFEWDMEWRRGRTGDDKREPTADVSRPANAPPRVARSQPASRPASRPSGEPNTPAAEPDPKTVLADSREDSADDAVQQMEIYWTGPLDIVPTGRTEHPDPDRFRIAGRGEDVMLYDTKTMIICREFDFRNPQEEANFTGAEGKPVRLILSRGEQVTCEGTIHFANADGEAILDGPGTMTRYAAEPEDLSWAQLSAGQVEPGRVAERITWTERVETQFEMREVTTDEGETRQRPFISDATFLGNVYLQQIPSPEDIADAGGTLDPDFVRCGKLQVFMETDEENRPYPTRAIASNSVHARQEGSEIRGGSVEIQFRRRIDAPDVQARADSDDVTDLKFRVEPTHIVAENGVRLTHTPRVKPGETPKAPLHATAQKLDAVMNYVGADKPQQLAVLTGEPAAVWQGPNRLEGNTIRFDETNEAAVVQGPGEMQFEVRQDLNGNDLEDPRAATIRWTKQMEYQGKAGYGRFIGEVDLNSGEEALDCRELRLFFQPEEPKDDATEVAAAEKRERREIGLGMEEFDKRRISVVEAYGGKDEKEHVHLQTKSMQRDNASSPFLVRRQSLRGEFLQYNAIQGKAFVRGAGRFFAEDYRRPEEKSDASRGGAATAGMDTLERPSQTLFLWSRQMVLDDKARSVQLNGDVTMVHRSGSKVFAPAKLRTVPWGRLTKGRQVELKADAVQAWFAPPTDKERKKGDTVSVADAGSQFGPLEKLNAVGDVTFEDVGSMGIDAAAVLYDATRHLVNAWGSLPNQPVKNAAITFERATGGQPPKVESPIIIYNTKTGDLKLQKPGAGGGV